MYMSLEVAQKDVFEINAYIISDGRDSRKL